MVLTAPTSLLRELEDAISQRCSGQFVRWPGSGALARSGPCRYMLLMPCSRRPYPAERRPRGPPAPRERLEAGDEDLLGAASSTLRLHFLLARVGTELQPLKDDDGTPK